MKLTKLKWICAVLCSAVFVTSIPCDFGTANAEDNQPAVRWVRGENDWGFYNARAFMGSEYYLTEQDKATFFKDLKNTEKFAINRVLNDPWTGGCYGYSATSVLSCYGLIPYEQYALNASAVPQCLNDVGFPYSSKTASSADVTVPPEVRSLINAYQLLQLKDSHRQDSARLMYRYTEQERLQMLMKLMEEGTPALIAIFFSGEHPEAGRMGHALVAYGVEDCKKDWERKTYDKKILLGDPNSPYKVISEFYENAQRVVGIYGTMYVNTEDWSWYIPSYGRSDDGANLGQILSDPDLLNQGGVLPGTTDPKTQEPFIGVLTTNWLKGDYHLKKAKCSGNTVSVQSDADFKRCDAFYPDYVESAVLNFLTEDSEDAYALQLDEPQEVEMLMYYENSIQRVQSQQMAEAAVAPSGYAGFAGERDAYSLEIITNDGYPTPWYDVRVDGVADAASLTILENGYLLTAKHDGILEVTVKNDAQTIARCYRADADLVLISESSNGELSAAVDLDGNGSYETELAEYFMLGDVNLDGSVNAKDASEVLIAAARIGTGQKTGLSESRQKAADADHNGNINAVDATWILRYAAAIGTGTATRTLADYMTEK